MIASFRITIELAGDLAFFGAEIGIARRSARPSASRTMGAPRISTGRPRSRTRLPDHQQLLIVLFAEHRDIGHGRDQELGDHGGDAGKEMRAEIRFQSGAGAAHRDGGGKAVRIHLLRSGREDQIGLRRPAWRDRPPGCADRRRNPRCGANWAGLTKMLTTTRSACSCASRTSDRWPSCSAPRVGTRPCAGVASAHASATVVTVDHAVSRFRIRMIFISNSWRISEAKGTSRSYGSVAWLRSSHPERYRPPGDFEAAHYLV